MSKKKFMTLLLAIVLCVNSSVVFAGEYGEEKTHQGYKVTMIGKLTTPTTFYGSTQWAKPDGEVSMVAETYIRDNETGGIRSAESGSTNILTGFCSIDQNHSSFNGGYAIVKVEFTHNVLYMKPTDDVYNYTYTASY